MKKYKELTADLTFDKRQEKVIKSTIKNEKISDKVSIMINNSFDWRQMEQIKIGLKKGVDVKIYASPKNDWKVMRQARLLLEAKKVSEKELKDYCKKFNDKQLNEIRLGLKAGLKIDSYTDPKFNFYEMSEKRKSLLQHCSSKKM